MIIEREKTAVAFDGWHPMKRVPIHIIGAFVGLIDGRGKRNVDNTGDIALRRQPRIRGRKRRRRGRRYGRVQVFNDKQRQQRRRDPSAPAFFLVGPQQTGQSVSAERAQAKLKKFEQSERNANAAETGRKPIKKMKEKRK